jgi:hypothetical protein
MICYSMIRSTYTRVRLRSSLHLSCPAGTYARTITFARGATTDQNSTVRVNYISAPPSSDVSGEIVRVSTSTAVEGTHYRITGGSSYTIKAGSNSVDVPIQLLAGGLANGASATLVLELAPGQGFEVSEKYKRFTFTLRKST